MTPFKSEMTIAFLVNSSLGVSLSLWAIDARPQDRYLVLCKKGLEKHFEKPNVEIIETEKDIFAANPDIVFSLNYWKIIKKKYTQKFIITNLHHSYNLTYRGRHMCSWAIINARKHNLWVHGTTMHIMDEHLDCGRIIYSYPCPIYENDTAYSLYKRCEELAERKFTENYLKILQGDYKTKKFPPGKFHYSERDLTHQVDLSLPPIEIYDRVRALTFPGKPVPYAIVNGQVIELVWK